MAPPPPPSKLYSDDVSLIVLLLDTNPYFWTAASNPSSPLSFSTFLSHVLSFLNSILLLNQLNQIVVIATGYNSCGYVYDSSLLSLSKMTQSSGNGVLPGFCEELLGNLEGFLEKDEKLSSEGSVDGVPASLLSWFLSMALCYIQRVFRSVPLHPQPRTVFATDLHSRNFLQLPKPVGVDFRASCFCHKNTIGMGYICSVCLSIFCKHQKECSTCGSVFGQSQAASASDRKRKDPQE